MGVFCLKVLEESWARPFVNGAIASVAAELVTFPIDLAKTRLQIQGQAIDSRYTKLRYRGPAHAIVKIIKYEGVPALYCGLAPAVLRQSVYGGLKRGIYMTLGNLYNGVQSFSVNFTFGLLSGMSAAALCNPIDIMKVRMQTQGMTLPNCVKQLVYQDGFKGWFRGVTPNMCRTGILVATTFSVYDETLRITQHDYGIPYAVSYTISSAFASILGSVVANPMDVIKSRMMNQSRNNVRYRNMLHCCHETYKAEGFRAFGKGFLATLCRSAPWHFVFFLTNDYLGG